jgi:hypothetical protein
VVRVKTDNESVKEFRTLLLFSERMPGLFLATAEDVIMWYVSVLHSPWM